MTDPWLYQLDETSALRLTALAGRSDLPAAALLLKQLAAAGLSVRRYGDQASLDHADGRELPVSFVHAFAAHQQEFGARLIALGARDFAAWVTPEQIKIPRPDPDPRDQERGREGERPRRWRGGAAVQLKDDEA
jgi:hypothetical protein